jgi:hypothetical protein
MNLIYWKLVRSGTLVAAGVTVIGFYAWFTMPSGGFKGDETAHVHGHAHGDRPGDHRPNGFDVSNAIIPQEEILRGGPPRDGIPAIDKPRFTTAEAAAFMQSDDQVISVTMAGETRAYPLRILVWHEIVNDQIGGHSFAVTYCPLCGTAMVFDRQLGERTLSFGVSGLLYNSDVLMYDRETESLWSQLGMIAVSGPLVETPLEWLPSEQLTWVAWRELNPDGMVLSTETGHARDYGRLPYAGYEESPEIFFPVPEHRTELPRKAWVLGIVQDGQAKAYPLEKLPAREPVTDHLNRKSIQIYYDPSTQLARITDENGRVIPSVRSYWFAWQAFYPKTELWDR